MAQKEPVVRLSRSTDASSMRMVSNADGSYTAGSSNLGAGARVEHCFSTQAGERIRLVQILSSQTDGEQSSPAGLLPLLGSLKGSCLQNRIGHSNQDGQGKPPIPWCLGARPTAISKVFGFLEPQSDTLQKYISGAWQSLWVKS